MRSKLKILLSVILLAITMPFGLSFGEKHAKLDANMDLANRTLVHRWDEGPFKGAKYSMEFSGTHIKWKAIAGKPKGMKGNDKYKTIVLANNIKRVAWQEVETGYKLVIDYDFNDMTANGLIFVGDDIVFLRSHNFQVVK